MLSHLTYWIDRALERLVPYRRAAAYWETAYHFQTSMVRDARDRRNAYRDALHAEHARAERLHASLTEALEAIREAGEALRIVDADNRVMAAMLGIETEELTAEEVAGRLTKADHIEQTSDGAVHLFLVEPS